ncbi:glycosyltransferase [Natronolimnobius baerhuensis]|uniref:Glycosyl transferase n=1 Tax=Natronolimnobius baerhuensis TaxID=253108 RepID=A0A202EDD9_9EURY|nr:glycosyltransferase family 2 protein [Natronolimnobius baerhuensis]OVE86235.1 hypothetical protein B2G88_05480 [Natronolimnobius baerhuensis]
MASVILPTNRWTDAAESVIKDLRDSDELLIVCDSSTAPVADEAPNQATVVIAGEPTGCSGKAHALATGMEHATDDIIVWTDDDVHREAGWIETLTSKVQTHDAATEVPVYTGSGLWQLFEPALIIAGTSGTASGRYVWGGGVAFDRTKLDETAFLRDLRRTVGDDSLLSEYVDDIWAETDHCRHLEVDGSPEAVYHRLVRFGKTSWRFEPLQTSILLGMSLAFSAGALMFPIVGVIVATVLGGLAYWKLGITRASVLLSYPSLLLVPVFLILALVAPSFEWGGRTYKWSGKFDVQVVS